MVDPTTKLISRIHHKYDRRKYHVIVLLEYLIIILLFSFFFELFCSDSNIPHELSVSLIMCFNKLLGTLPLQAGFQMWVLPMDS